MDVNLVMFKSDGQRKDFPLTNSVSVIGRGEECDLQIPLLNVSRRHCELRLDQGVIRVKDLASSNGTYLNNDRISEGELAAGDRLAIGPIVFTVQVDGQPEEVTPVKTRGQVAAEGAADGETLVTEDVEIELAPEAGAQAAEEVLQRAPAPAADPEAAAEAALSLAPEPDDDEPADPISALEALAAESRKKEK